MMNLFVLTHQNSEYFVVVISPLRQPLDKEEGQLTNYLFRKQIVCKFLDLSILKESFQFVRNYSRARESQSLTGWRSLSLFITCVARIRILNVVQRVQSYGKLLVTKARLHIVLGSILQCLYRSMLVWAFFRRSKRFEVGSRAFYGHMNSYYSTCLKGFAFKRVFEDSVYT